jgi:hypothetical protein
MGCGNNCLSYKSRENVNCFCILVCRCIIDCVPLLSI